MKNLTGYTIDFDGNVVLGQQTGRVRFELHSRFGTNNAWQEFTARVLGKPADLEISGSAADEKLSLLVKKGEEALIGDAVERRLGRLAEAVGCEPSIGTL